MSREEKDKKNKQFGAIVSIVTHVALFLLFIFLIAWRAPNPPNPEIGIELNFGTSAQGSGEVQPEPNVTPADTESEEDAAETPEEQIEDPVEEAVEEVIESNTSSEEVKPVTEIPTEAPVKEPEVKKVENKPKVEEKETPTPPKVLYPGTKDETATEAKNANQGDKTDAVGDQGDKEGDVDARALYGTPGGGAGGSMLEMAGWMWDEAPDPKETTDQDGKIVFEVVIDDKGNVVSAKAVSYTVSISLVKVYQSEVELLTFSKTTSGPAPDSSKGVITFLIKAK